MKLNQGVSPRYLVSLALFLVGLIFVGFIVFNPGLESKVNEGRDYRSYDTSPIEIYEGVALEYQDDFATEYTSNTELSLALVPEVPISLTTHIYPAQYNGEITFKGGNIVFPKTNVAISRAFGSVGDALSVCMDGRCFNKCDHLAGDIWGYEDASGYYSAFTHWQTAVAQGIAVPDDREPPLGALLFWETGKPFGHVATYIGNGMVVTNAGGEYGSNVYIYYADWYDVIGYKYLGWAPPVFFGEDPGSAL